MKAKRLLGKIGKIEISYLPKAPDHGLPELAVVLDGRFIPVAVGDRAVALWNSPLDEEGFRGLARKYEQS